MLAYLWDRRSEKSKKKIKRLQINTHRSRLNALVLDGCLSWLCVRDVLGPVDLMAKLCQIINAPKDCSSWSLIMWSSYISGVYLLLKLRISECFCKGIDREQIGNFKHIYSVCDCSSNIHIPTRLPKRAISKRCDSKKIQCERAWWWIRQNEKCR
jgi:hypothetical protein